MQLTEPSGSSFTQQPIEVLRSEDQIVEARRWIRAHGWDVRQHPAAWMRARLGYALRHAGILRVDETKSWDVAYFSRFIVDELSRDDLAVDVGAVASELPWILHLAGYRRIVACDLSRRVLRMPFAGQIDYRVGPLNSLGLHRGSVAVVSAVSVIEHGLDLEAFFFQTSELLRPGGILCLSTDYWPEPISTDDVRIFGFPWRIFNARDISMMLRSADAAGLELQATPQSPSITAPVIRWSGRSYTFLAMVLRKRAP